MIDKPREGTKFAVEDQEVTNTSVEQDILKDRELFQDFVNNCDPTTFRHNLANGNDFSTFWSDSGWGDG